VLDEIYAPDFVYHDPARPHVTDLASYRQFAAEECFGAFPGFRMPVEDIIAEADRVAARWTFAGTHIALGRPVVQKGITIARIADGKIVEAWCACDMLGTIIQLTAVTPADPGSEGLVAYYPLDAGASDASGNGLDGVVMGDTRLTDGIIGGAMEFDGDGDYIEVAHNALLDITGPISLSLWIRPDAEDPEGQGTETAPMAKAFSTANPSWSWQVRYGWGSAKPYMAFTFNTSPRAWAYVNQNLAQGEWHHIACSADGQTLTAYLNGLATESTPMGAITSSPTPVLIGSDGWSCDWIGAIDEVAIYNRALSAEEMLYLAGFGADAEEEVVE
jgi:ketosteroid isomerase-like protein